MARAHILPTTEKAIESGSGRAKVLAEQVRVAVQRFRSRGVAELVLHHFDVRTIGHHERRSRVPQVVNT